jgi:uncharacterized protein YciI
MPLISWTPNVLFAVYCLDGESAAQRRQENYPAHRQFLGTAADYGVKIVISGPITKEDGETPMGSLFVLEAENRAAVEKFNQADPFARMGVWQDTAITGFVKKHG